MSQAISFRGTPRTSEEWAALTKIASGHPDLTKEELRRLFMLGLVSRELGRICLSPHGRETLRLGIPDGPHALHPSATERFTQSRGA